MDKKDGEDFIPALQYRWLTPLFDPFVRWTTRETTFKRHLVKRARIENGHRVLDLGCGTGTLAIMAKKAHPGAAVTGLDADPRILAIAKAKIARAGLDITLDRGMAFDLPYADGSFDRVLSTLLFHHLTTGQKARAFCEAFRVLRPGGELHLADFGEPATPLMSLISLVMRRFERTSDNIRGYLPLMMVAAGFNRVIECVRYSTVFGSISLCQALKPTGPRATDNLAAATPRQQ